METRRPLVSVLIRSMDRPTLDRALASVAAQSYPNIEAVVVAACGASHRSLPESLGHVRVRLIRSEVQLPRPFAANVGLDAARGEYINLLDDDDDWLPRHAEILVRALEATPSAGLAYSQSMLLDEQERPYAVFGLPFDPISLFYNPLFDPPSAMFRRSLLDTRVRFDERFQSIEDVDFWVQCSLQTRFIRVPTVTCRVRPAIGTSGTSGSTGNANRNVARLRADGALFESKWAAVEAQVGETPTGMLHRAKRHLQSGNHSDARTLLERAYRLTPTDVNVLNLLGMARHYDGESAHGLPLVEQALRLAPGHPGLMGNLELLRGAAANEVRRSATHGRS